MIKKDYKYRFKTLEEFRKDYGHGWRNLDGRTSFIPEMDNLLGTDIDGSWYDNIDLGIKIIISYQGKRYGIIPMMYVKENIFTPPRYKRKIFIKN